MKTGIIAGLVAGLVGGLVVLIGLEVRSRLDHKKAAAAAELAERQVAESHRRTCRNQLLMIDSAIQQWALENNKRGDAIPEEFELSSYIPHGFPICPDGGRYKLTGSDNHPSCSADNHNTATFQ